MSGSAPHRAIIRPFSCNANRLPTLALPFRANCPTRADLFRQIFRDHFDRWCDLWLDDEVPPDHQAYVREIMQRMMVCRDPEADYARYECPNCGFDVRVPFSCKSRFCPSCGKVRLDDWVNAIAADSALPSKYRTCIRP